MAKFHNDHVQALLRQAEERLDGSSTLPKQMKEIAGVHSINETKAGKGMSTTPSKAVPPQPQSARAPDSEMKSHSHKKDTAGSHWFNLPKTDLTPDFRREWQLLRMRGVLDPKHQKKTLRLSPPKYSQVGEIVEGPTDFYSARLSRRDRKRTIMEHLMTEHDDLKLKSKYAAIQQDKISGKRASYQKLVFRRRRKRS